MANTIGGVGGLFRQIGENTSTVGQPTGTTNDTQANVGDFITDVRFRPFIRAQQVYFSAFGLRPLTRVYPFFDKQDVSARCHPATVINESNPITKDNLRANWSSTTLTVDNAGRLFGVFDLPAETFIVGERELLFADVDDLDSFDSATTQCSAQFNAFNFSVSNAPVPAPRPPVIQNPPSITFPLLISFMDPLAESFLVDPDLCAGRAGCFLTKVDLYFKSKSLTLGINVELRTMENGVPTKTILPFSQVHKNAADVLVSNIAAQATTFTFPSPVYVRAGQEYALAIIPDANNPDYTLFVAEIGKTDVLTPTVSVTQDWGVGTLFMSHNNSTWTPLQNEDLKFTLYRADFTEGDGTAILVNEDYEFITLSSINGTFEPGEYVFENAAVANGTCSVVAGNNIVSGNGTAFLSQYGVGGRMVLKSGTTYDVQTITAITNNISLTVKDSLAFTNTAATHIATPSGIVYSFDADTSELVLEQSNAANSTYLFGAANTLIGETSSANAVIGVVHNRIVNRFQPMLYRTAAQGTNITLEGHGLSNAYVADSDHPLAFNATNYFDNEEIVIASKSNEITNFSGAKSFVLSATLDTETDMLSATLDKSTLGITAYENLINNDDTNEYKSTGNAISRSVSLGVKLADGLESEDIRVFLTAYRPAGTDIEVYAKLLADADSEAFSSKYWTKLERQRDDLSDGGDRSSQVEIEYRLPDTPVTTLLTGVVAVTNAQSNVVGTSTLFDADLAAGDVVLISNGSDYFISGVSVKTSNTNITLTTNAPWTASGATISKLAEPHTAWRNPQNDNVVSYINSSGAIFNEYKSFALKIVLLSEGTHVVPRVRDLRAIAMTV